ncbi:hypothetical protein Ac2012v2_001905 [Leucoagaricus gongylophorus]
MKKRDQMCPVFEPTKAPSVSSLRSVALSDNAAGPRTGRVASSSSLAESFEEISIPPPLPQRPAPSLPYVPRRVPPLRSATTGSSNLIPTPTLDPLVIRSKRPTPVPSAARKRYISVFNANILQRRRAQAQNPSPRKLSYVQAKTKRTRQAAGWRGLSVDLITATPEELVAHGQNIQGKEWDIELVVNESIGPDETLQGQIVKAIWLRSRIEKSKLAEIWNECDPQGKGSLDADSFARGMWRIDEHLRRTQAPLRSAASTSLRTARSLRISSAHPQGPPAISTRPIATSVRRSSTGLYSPPPPLPKIVLQ